MLKRSGGKATDGSSQAAETGALILTCCFKAFFLQKGFTGRRFVVKVPRIPRQQPSCHSFGIVRAASAASDTGASPSGKAAGFDPAMRWFESSRPCHFPQDHLDSVQTCRRWIFRFRLLKNLQPGLHRQAGQGVGSPVRSSARSNQPAARSTSLNTLASSSACTGFCTTRLPGTSNPSSSA